jgi:TPR repeat protein
MRKHDPTTQPLIVAILMALFVIGSAVPGAPICAQVMMFDSGSPVTFEEETARFLPGVYYFKKGVDYFKKGQAKAAMDTWEIAAGWAMKDAQYNLGLAYFKGSGIAADRPRGLAWLALAAERKNAALQTSLAAAWDSATGAEHEQANAIWRELKKQYGDDVALPRARRHFENELGQITGSRVGSTSAKVVSRSMGKVDSATYKARLQELAEQNFGASSGSVDVGPIAPANGGGGKDAR